MFVPRVDQLLTVLLPGEILRTQVAKVIDQNTVFVRLDATPLNPSKAHSYRKGDLVAVRRNKGMLGECWEAVDDRVLFARAPQTSEPPLPAKRKAKAKRKATV